MPEFPEVEAYRHVAERAVGSTIAALEVLDDLMLRRSPPAPVLHGILEGSGVLAARRTGKALLVDITAGHTVAIGFGLRGRVLIDRLAARPDGTLHDATTGMRPVRDEHIRLRLTLDDDRVIELEDQLRMSSLELDRDESDFGVDALDLTREQLAAVLGASRVAVKSRLMDQRRIAGLGNLIVDGILWEAGIDPARRSDHLDADELDRLFDATVHVREVVAVEGTGRTPMITAGSRTVDEPCDLDGAPMAKKTVGGRTSYYCPQHQQ